MWHQSTRRDAGSDGSWYGQESTGNYDNGQANKGALQIDDVRLPLGQPALIFSHGATG